MPKIFLMALSLLTLESHIHESSPLTKQSCRKVSCTQDYTSWHSLQEQKSGTSQESRKGALVNDG